MYDRILVPLDGSAPSARGFDEALRLARAGRGTLVLLHVVDDLPMAAELAPADAWEAMRRRAVTRGEALLAEAVSDASRAGVDATPVLREITAERVADAIVDQARRSECDLIVMGTHGRHGLERLAMGSDAELVLRHAPVPVMMVRRPPPH